LMAFRLALRPWKRRYQHLTRLWQRQHRHSIQWSLVLMLACEHPHLLLCEHQLRLLCEHQLLLPGLLLQLCS